MSIANWNPTAFYLVGDEVYDGTANYYTANANNHNDPPPSANWTLIPPPGGGGSDLDFDFQNYISGGGLPINPVGSPTWTPLNTIVYTPPANGSILAECVARLVNPTPVAVISVVMTMSVNGTNVPGDTVPVVCEAYAPNTNFFGVTSWEIPCVAGVPLTIECVAQTTQFNAPGVGDALCNSSRLSLTFVSS